jgi:eukaryotic-like serine/threonine-protein kinase
MPRKRPIETNSTDRDIRFGTRPDRAISDTRAQRLAQQAREKWRRKELDGVSDILESYPELLAHRTLVIELAHEEYLERRRSNDSLDMREFANQFPGFETSLYLYLNVQSLMGDSEQLDELVCWPEQDEVFLGFRIIEELGRGAFARVYLASEDALGDRLVALKVAQHGNTEATILGRLNHPNIVHVHSVQQDPESGLTAVCMPYIGRATLTNILDHGFSDDSKPRNAESAFWSVQPLSDESQDVPPRHFSKAKGSYEDEVVRLGIQLADALAHSHHRGICHRDIKPSNVLLDFDGRPLLLDFNLSVDARSWLERVGGTLPYMAPEDLNLVVAEEKTISLQADPRSDIFSLGVILYQLLSGRLPFEPSKWTPSAAEVAIGMLLRQREKPESIRRRNRGVGVALEEVVFECLKFDPNERIQTVSELAARLRRYFRPIPRINRWRRRHPWHVGTALGLTSLVLACWGGYLALRPPYAERMYAAGIEHYENAEFDESLDCLNEAIRHDRDSVEALMARGKVHLARQDLESAFSSFNDARSLSDSAAVCSALGYCAAQLDHHEEAVIFYSQANDQGDRSVALLNNMAFSLLRQNNSSEAARLLDSAVEAEPANPIVCHNLLVAHLHSSLVDGSVSKEAIEAADRAAECGLPSAQLFHDLAAVYALGARTDPALVEQAIKYLGRAVEQGLPVESVQGTVFSSLYDLPEYGSFVASALPKSEASPLSPQYLILPF